MESFESFLRMLAYVVFFGVIPVVVIYFRVYNRLGTGFAVGMILTSFFIGLLVAGSIVEDPVDEFVRIINTGDEDESKKALMRVVQMGDEAFLKIDERKIQNRDLYEDLQNRLIKEYSDIAVRYYNNNKEFAGQSCGDMAEFEKHLYNLAHALRVLSFAETLGAAKPALRREIDAAVKNRAALFEKLKAECTPVEE